MKNQILAINCKICINMHIFIDAMGNITYLADSRDTQIAGKK